MINNDLTAIVVLYNPDDKVINNLIHHKNIFKHIIVVDNSETTFYTNVLERLIKKDINNLCVIPNITYIPLNGNKGIAFALNVGLAQAILMNEKWVMLLDQDSKFSKQSVDILLTDLNSVDYSKTAIVAGNHNPDKYPIDIGLIEPNDNILITSGSIINLSVTVHEGGMWNELFIDCVDYDFCYKMISRGYKIYRDTRAVFEHNIGTPIIIEGTKCLNYSPMRYFYISRNNRIVRDIYENSIQGVKEYSDMILNKYYNMTTLEDNSTEKILAWEKGKRAYDIWKNRGQWIGYDDIELL